MLRYKRFSPGCSGARDLSTSGSLNDVLSSVDYVQSPMVKWRLKCELEVMWKEVVVA